MLLYIIIVVYIVKLELKPDTHQTLQRVPAIGVDNIQNVSKGSELSRSRMECSRGLQSNLRTNNIIGKLLMGSESLYDHG